MDQSHFVLVSYPKKHWEAAQMTAPFRTSGRIQTGHTEKISFLRSVLVYSYTSAPIMYPKRGGNTPLMSEHHKETHVWFATQNKTCCNWGSTQRIARSSPNFTAGVWTLSFTVYLKAARSLLRASSVRPACWKSVRTSAQTPDWTQRPPTPASSSGEILWAWSVPWSFLPWGAHSKKSPMSITAAPVDVWRLKICQRFKSF